MLHRSYPALSVAQMNLSTGTSVARAAPGRLRQDNGQRCRFLTRGTACLSSGHVGTRCSGLGSVHAIRCVSPMRADDVREDLADPSIPSKF